MAFLAPAIRWPDVLGVDAVTKFQHQFPQPISDLPSDVFLSVFASVSFILLLTIASSALRRSSPSAVPVFASEQKQRKAKDTPNVVLVGPSGVGKTSLFSALAFDSVPSVHPSQRESESVFAITSEGTNELKEPIKRKIRLVDTPGHPRIKDRIVEEHIKEADVIAFCVDAKESLRAAGSTKEDGVVEAVDHLHAALTQLAKSRRDAKSRPPTLLILFTRSDLAPLLSNVSLASTEAEDDKRRGILLQRAKATIESELTRRRSGMGLGAKRTSKIGGMSKVTGGKNSEGMWSTIRTLLGWRATITSEGEEEEEDDDVRIGEDYLASQSTEKAGISSTASLSKLDSRVVFQGAARFAFTSVGTERGWSERSIEGLQALKQTLATI